MKNVQDIYPATPMQQLMLLHTLAQKSSDTLLTQFIFAIDGAVDAQALRGAWEAVVERHPMLRTAFVTQKVETPLQIVRQRVTLPFESIDLREHNDPDAALEQLCRDDRRAGIDPARAPLMRLFLLRLAADQWRLVWTSHHLLMDRWCLGQIFTDLDAAYAALQRKQAPQLPAAPAFRQYVDWLGQQDTSEAVDFWRSELAGFTHPTGLASSRPAAAQPQAHKFTLPGSALQKLTDAARRFAVSKGTLVQAALAMVVAEVSRRSDVVFGIAAAARPPAVPNVESIVGSFVNNLPVRATLDPDQSIAQWLKSMQQAAFARSDFEYLSPLTIAEHAVLPEGQALFDTLLVWLAPSSARLPLDMTPLSDEMATAYPLTISVEEQADTLTLHVHQRADDPEHAAQILDRLRHYLLGLAGAQAQDALGPLLAEGLAAIAGAAPSPAAGHPSPVVRATDTTAQDTRGREVIPAAMMEQLVAHQFAQALELDSVDPDQDFFELGGNSLRAAQLHANVCQGTRKNVPLLALFKEPTVNGITRLLMQNDWPSKPGMVLPLRSGGRGAPLICVASPEVNTVGYFVLSRRLPPHQDAAVLQAPPLSDTPTPMDPDIIEPMARDYVAALRDYQPQGPYKLLGMCGGAHLALAMARQLHQDNQRIEFFGVVNTWSLYSVSWVYYLHRARRVLAYYRQRVLGLLGVRAAPSAAPAARVEVMQTGPANEDVGLGSPWIRDVGFAHRNPGAPKLPLRTHVLRIERQQYWRIRDEALGWSQFFDTADVHRLPGRFHDNLMREPYVIDLANALAPLLDDAPSEGANSAPVNSRKSTTEILS